MKIEYYQDPRSSPCRLPPQPPIVTTTLMFIIISSSVFPCRFLSAYLSVYLSSSSLYGLVLPVLKDLVCLLGLQPPSPPGSGFLCLLKNLNPLADRILTLQVWGWYPLDLVQYILCSLYFLPNSSCIQLDFLSKTLVVLYSFTRCLYVSACGRNSTLRPLNSWEVTREAHSMPIHSYLFQLK